MADSDIQIPPDSSGKQVDMTQFSRPDPTLTTMAVYRERVDIGDGAIDMRELRDLLREIVQEIRDLKISLLDALH